MVTAMVSIAPAGGINLWASSGGWGRTGAEPAAWRGDRSMWATAWDMNLSNFLVQTSFCSALTSPFPPLLGWSSSAWKSWTSRKTWRCHFPEKDGMGKHWRPQGWCKSPHGSWSQHQETPQLPHPAPAPAPTALLGSGCPCPPVPLIPELTRDHKHIQLF